MALSWGYDEHNGPSTWAEEYPHAGGNNQSPIDFEVAQIQCASELLDNPLTWNYSRQICKSITNTGHGWKVDIQSDEDSGLSGGPLEHNYELAQFHCHWGHCSGNGSEHTLDGKAYDAELHFVHWNKDCFQSCDDAVSQPKGLAVIGVFLEIGETNEELDNLCELIKKIPFRDQASADIEQVDISALFPDDHSYWTYDGSLTTPPCYESVVWIVFKNPISVSETQLECFRQMYSDIEDTNATGTCQLTANFRPAQALNDRTVRECPHS